MDLGDRMKDYERRGECRLQRKVPVLGRLDGKAFHTLTRGLERPFDADFAACMQRAAAALCENIQGCQIAYVQSDEITLLLKDWQSHGTAAWFDYRLSKMCSVAASIATDAFGAEWEIRFGERPRRAWFDARFWNVCREEVCNAFIWRQRDATKNSVTMLAQSHFSHRQLHGKNGSEQQDMLMREHGVNWNDRAVWEKRGVCVRRAEYEHMGLNPKTNEVEVSTRSRWMVDHETPIFTRDRGYIDGLLTNAGGSPGGE